MGKTSISWTDFSFNPWIGCQKTGELCRFCYAESYANRFNKAKWGSGQAGGTRQKTSDQTWREPLRWNRQAEAAGERRRVFCASLADVFEHWPHPVLNHRGERLYLGAHGAVLPMWENGSRPLVLDDLRGDLFGLIDQTPWLDWLLLTKRPDLILKMWRKVPEAIEAANTAAGRHSQFRQNVWLGTSVGNQQTADEAVPVLLRSHALVPVLFLSCEPMLGPVDLTAIRCPGGWSLDALTGVWSREHTGDHEHPAALEQHEGPRIGWIIAGGESGPQARPMHPGWARSLRDQCAAASVPFHFKQWGEWSPFYDRDRDDPDWRNVPPADDDVARVNLAGGQGFHGDQVVYLRRVGKEAAGRLLDGVLHDAVPEVPRG